VIVTSGNGRAGSGTGIAIRGRSTISLSQQPLVYVDGVRVTNDVGRERLRRAAAVFRGSMTSALKTSRASRSSRVRLPRRSTAPRRRTVSFRSSPSGDERATSRVGA
jgi:hypothetical protein